MDGRIFDGIISTLITIGIVIGIALCAIGVGVFYLALWLVHHVHFS